MISENCISLLWPEEIIVIGYNLVSFQIFPNFMEHMSVLTKCNALFKNEHLILIWFFLLIDNEFDLKHILRILNSEIIKNINENPQNVVIFKIVFSIHVSFSVSIENHPCYPNKEKTYTLFVYSYNIFPDIDPNEHINTI